MKNENRLSVIAVLLALTSAPAFAVPGGADPLYVNMKVYEMRVSANADCSEPHHVVFTNASPTYQDLLSNPTLGSGQIPNGTYNCVMIKISDQIESAPDANAGVQGVCQSGVPFTADVAPPEDALGHDDLNGTNHAHTTGDDTPWIYFFTGSVGTGQGAFTHAAGLPLTSPLVVNGTTQREFVWNFDDQVFELFSGGVGPWVCNLEAPTISFR